MENIGGGYTGNYFTNIKKDDIDVYWNGIRLVPDDIRITRTQIIYSFEIPEDVSNLEFRVLNTSDQTVEIKRIDIYQDAEFEGPEQLKEWWTKDYLKNENLLFNNLLEMETSAPFSEAEK